MNNYQNKKKYALLFAALGGVVSGAQAAVPGEFYGGAAVGQLSYPDVADYYDNEDEVVKVEDSATAFKLLGGFQFTKNLALEAFYEDFGESGGIEQDVDEYYDGDLDDYVVSVDKWEETSALSGFGVTGKMMVPVNAQFDIYLTLSLLRWTVEFESTDSLIDNGEVQLVDHDSDNVSSTNLMYAVGASYRLTDSVSLYAEYSSLDASYDKGDWDYENKVDGFLLGINYHFGPVSTSQQTPAANTGSESASDRRSRSRSDADTHKRGDRSLTACDPKYKDISGTLCD